MAKLDRSQQRQAVRAIASRKLQAWMVHDWGRREGHKAYFDHIANTAWVLARSGIWMSEGEILAAWPEEIEQPHVMQLDDVERIMAYSKIAKTNSPMGWSKYRFPRIPDLVRRAASDFRFSEEYGRSPNDVLPVRDLVLADLFVPFPAQFGLRGDSFLWGKLAGYYWGWVISADTDIEQVIKDGFRSLVGQDFDSAPGEFFDEGLAHGGMSSGYVSMEWWRRTGLPLLVHRFTTIRPALLVDFVPPNDASG